MQARRRRQHKDSVYALDSPSVVSNNLSHNVVSSTRASHTAWPRAPGEPRWSGHRPQRLPAVRTGGCVTAQTALRSTRSGESPMAASLSLRQGPTGGKLRYPARSSQAFAIPDLRCRCKALRVFPPCPRTGPFCLPLRLGSPHNRAKRCDSARAEWSNGNRYALLAARRTFPLWVRL